MTRKRKRLQKKRKHKHGHKQGDDDEAYKSHHDFTAEILVQQVMCDTMPIEANANMSTFQQVWAQAV
jgi:hypothetical protein